MEELLDIGYWQESNIFNLNYDKPYTMIGFGVTVDFAIGAMSRQLVQLDREGHRLHQSLAATAAQ